MHIILNGSFNLFISDFCMYFFIILLFSAILFLTHVLTRIIIILIKGELRICQCIVPYHNKDLKKGLKQAILKEAGLR